MLRRLKFALYALILTIAAFWGSKEQYFDLWGEVVWVIGILIIESNIRGQRGLRRPPAGL